MFTIGRRSICACQRKRNTPCADRVSAVAWNSLGKACHGIIKRKKYGSLLLYQISQIGLSAFTALRLSLTRVLMVLAEFYVNEHTAEVAFPAETCGSSFNATWKGKVYSLAQFHYHAPSEHMVDGEYYPMEVHHVHKAVDGTVLVLGVFMYVNPALSPASCVGITIECSRAKFFDAILTLGQGSHAAA